MDSTEHMRIAAFQELKDALQVKRVNDELLQKIYPTLQHLTHGVDVT